MTWVKLDDKFHRNPKVMAMSDAAHRIYVDALSYCGDMPEPTGYLTNKEAAAFVKSRGKAGAVIKELVEINAWEDLPDGYMIHDFPDYLPQTSRDRTRRWRDAKRASQSRHSDVTEAPQSDVTEMSQGVTAHARAVPVPVAVTPSVVTAPEPVPVPEPVSKAPPTPSVSTAALKDALSNGHEDDLALQYAVRASELLGRDLAPLEVSMCGIFLDDFAYLSVDDMLQRMHDHLEHCKSEKLPLPRKLRGFHETLRLENEHRADARAPKAWRPAPIAGDLARLGVGAKDPDE